MMLPESRLFAPLAAWLMGQGYRVAAEVKGCDLIARKGDEMIAIEMKNRFSLALLLQITTRQEITESVYAAVPLSGSRGRLPKQKNLSRLLRRLGLGLLVVRFLKNKTRVEVILHPRPESRRRAPKKRLAIISEIDGRFAEFNQGGEPATTEKITAYKQACLQTAHLLSQMTDAAPRQIVERGGPAKSGLILNQNHYGWFEREKRGMYRLSKAGKAALKNYDYVIAKIVADKAVSG